MKVHEFINEAPLPPDWDPAQFQHVTTFKSRLAYALERAGDLARAANWGIYKGKPVIIDVGLNTDVLSQHYS
jgi:hypothetical protein